VKYRIGDVARILGISTDIIRYYEKKGVVSPVKDRLNDYRYYDTWDINYLIDCLWFKKFGFGIEEIAGIVTDCSYDQLLNLMMDKSEEMEDALRMQEMLLECMKSHCRSLESITDFMGVCDVCESPEIVCYLNRYNQTYDNRMELQKISRRWQRYMPFSKRYFEILGAGGEDEPDGYAWGFSLDAEYLDDFDIAEQPPVVHYQPQLSIHSAFKSAGKDGFTPRHADFLKEYAEKNGYEACAGARGNLVCSVVENNRLTGYFEVWLPVKKK